MNETGKKPLKTKRGLLLLVIGLVLVAALILLFLGLRAGGWAAKKENMELLTLVNADNPAPEDRQQEYAMLDEGWMLDVRCAGELQLLLDDCFAAGYFPEIREALVTRGLQSERFDEKVRELTAQGLDEEAAVAEAAKTVPPPGYSEHELGLAVDILDPTLPDEQQAESPMQLWLADNAWRHGFIQRYPAGKSEATGVAYAPWHYRYVGREAAQQIWELGLSLEEYIDLFYPEQ